jgi:hypothetical protein
MSHGKSYAIFDIEWFCQTINNLFNNETRVHKKTEHLIEQFKHTIGTNIHMISKYDSKKLKIKSDEVCNHIQLLSIIFLILDRLFNSWNLAYSVSIEDQSDNNIFVLFNSISPEPPIPLVDTYFNINLNKKKFYFIVRTLFGLNHGHLMIMNLIFIFIYYIFAIHRFFFVFINYFHLKNYYLLHKIFYLFKKEQ